VKIKIKGKVCNTDKAQEIVNWIVGEETDEHFYWECLYRADDGQYFVASTCWERNYKGSTWDIKLLANDEVWPLLADRKVDPDRVKIFFRREAKVMDGGKLIGVLWLLGK